MARPQPGALLVPSGINMEGSEGTFRAGGTFWYAQKIKARPIDLGPQNIPEALVAARHTAEFRRRTLEYSWDLKKLKIEQLHNLFCASLSRHRQNLLIVRDSLVTEEVS